jgi:hypothetical protein
MKAFFPILLLLLLIINEVQAFAPRVGPIATSRIQPNRPHLPLLQLHNKAQGRYVHEEKFAHFIGKSFSTKNTAKIQSWRAMLTPTWKQFFLQGN